MPARDLSVYDHPTAENGDHGIGANAGLFYESLHFFAIRVS
jgi:hypothetical protein